ERLLRLPQLVLPELGHLLEQAHALAVRLGDADPHVVEPGHLTDLIGLPIGAIEDVDDLARELRIVGHGLEGCERALVVRALLQHVLERSEGALSIAEMIATHLAEAHEERAPELGLVRPVDPTLEHAAELVPT